MSNLTAFNQDGIEIYINNTTGESFASISGYARMSGKDRSTISKRCKGCELNEIKTAEVLTRGGLQAIALIPEHLIVKWLRNDNPELADKIAILGIRVFLHQLSGYEVKSTATLTQTPDSYIDALKKLIAVEEEKQRLQLEAIKLIEENEELKDENQDLNDFKDEVSEYDKFLELLEISKNEVSDLLYSNGISINDFLIEWNNTRVEERLEPEYWATISKRSAQYFRLLEGKNPLKNNRNRTIFVGRKVAYIIATIRLVQSGI
jgi:hypothetical protein